MVAPRETLDRETLPQKTPHRFGLKSVARVEQKANGHWMFGSQWQENCGSNILVAPDNCDIALTQEQRTKQSFAQMLNDTSEEFTLYGFNRCSAVGSAISERSGIAMEELNLGEWHQVEKRFMAAVTAQGTTPYAPGISGAKNALGALLMQWDLPIEPTVHMSPNVAVMLDGQFTKAGNTLRLILNDSPLAVGFGYDTGNVATGWIALTGPVFIEHGTALENEQMDPATNTYLALAERPFTINYLCKAIFVQVNAVLTTTA